MKPDREQGAASIGDFAVPDLARAGRTGFPEVVLAQGKTPAEVRAVAARLLEADDRLLVTRVGADHVEALEGLSPSVRHHEKARIVTCGHDAVRRSGRVSILTAGTGDIPVAEEAAVTAEMMGAEVTRIYDVGVAGIHRLLDRRKAMEGSRLHVVVAGMEGALPSVVGGLVAEPVIAVPTSVGYGASYEGIAALLAMLNSCAPGVVVVNIDNGFGAGFAAGRWNAVFDRE